MVAADAYLTPATTDADGRPWVTPVWFATLACADFFWLSRPGTRHDRAAALAVFNSRGQEQGIGSWSEGDVSGAAQFRIYRARASRVYVIDEHDGRVEMGG